MPATVQPPVIVVPGIQGTGLEDFYPLPPEEVWSAILHKHYERISLHPDDLRYEAIEPARIQPRSLFPIIYQDLIEALRHDLSPRKDRPTPVFGFSYDWRQDCRISAEQLRSFVDEVLARTALLPHYHADGKPLPGLRVDLVGHSMGGLIIADYLHRYGKEGKVRKVASIATPFQGAVDATQKLATGMGSLTGEIPRDREREAARTIPAIYQLLPTYEGAVTADPGLSKDLFKVKTWQPSVLATLRAYIRLYEGRITAEKLLAQYLDAAEDHRGSVNKLSLSGVLPDGNRGWLAIAGLDAPTQVNFKIIDWKKGLYKGPLFDFSERVNKWPDDHNSTETGDGTVPFLGACPNFLKRNQLVCISPEEFELLEFRDRLLAKTAGFHAALPTVNLVQRIVLRFLRPRYEGDVEARLAPGETKPDWPVAEMKPKK